MPHQTLNRKTHCSQFFVGVPLRKFPERAGEGRAWTQEPTHRVCAGGEALPERAEEGRAHSLRAFSLVSGAV